MAENDPPTPQDTPQAAEPGSPSAPQSAPTPAPRAETVIESMVGEQTGEGGAEEGGGQAHAVGRDVDEVRIAGAIGLDDQMARRRQVAVDPDPLGHALGPGLDDVGEALLGRQAPGGEDVLAGIRRRRRRERPLDRAEHLGLVADRRAEILQALQRER